MSGRIITINSRKYDGTIRRSWNCGLVEQENDQLLFVGEFETDIEHPDLGLIRRGTVSYEYYWLDRWYNVFRFHMPGGELRNYYCNVNMPPTLQDDILDYVDLDIDVLVWPDRRYVVLDVEEFEVNAVEFGYPGEIKGKALHALDEIVRVIEAGELP